MCKVCVFNEEPYIIVWKIANAILILKTTNQYNVTLTYIDSTYPAVLGVCVWFFRVDSCKGKAVLKNIGNHFK